jgi:hypothetical protein
VGNPVNFGGNNVDVEATGTGRGVYTSIEDIYKVKLTCVDLGIMKASIVQSPSTTRVFDRMGIGRKDSE